MTNDQVAHITAAFAAWCLAGALLCLAAMAIMSNAQCADHGPQIAEGWTARVQPAPLARGAPIPRTYTLTPLPDIKPAPELDREHFARLLQWSIRRQMQREDMHERHRRGIVHPDEL